MTSTKRQNRLRSGSANLKLDRMWLLWVSTSVFPPCGCLYMCVYLQKLHMGDVCIPVVVPLRLLQLLFYISWLVTVVMHQLFSARPPPSLPCPSLTPWLSLRLSHFWWGGLKTQPIKASVIESNTDVTISWLRERKREARLCPVSQWVFVSSPLGELTGFI